MVSQARYHEADVLRWDALDRVGAGDRRSPFEVDRARIIHSSAFRRLQGKTQIFGVGEGDFYRTRLTHSMEVAQIGKGLALALNTKAPLLHTPLSLELIEAACLAHDLGHPPFGHTGEIALQQCMRNAGGFEANAQNLRIVSHLEAKRPGFGLNLTRCTLDSLLKYLQSYSECKAARSGDGAANTARVEKCFYDDDADLIDWVRAGHGRVHRLLESEVMEWADDIAYSVHDLEDGLHSGLITAEHLRQETLLERIAAYAAKKGAPGCTVGEVFEHLSDVFAHLRGGSMRQLKEQRKALTSRLIHACVVGTDVVTRDAPAPYQLSLAIAPAIRRKVAVLMGAEYVLMIRHPRVTTLEYKGKLVVTRLFEAHAQPDSGDLLPADIREMWEPHRDNEPQRLRIICDYIAGMTDAYALKLYTRMFEPGASGFAGIG
jgi:dGTPase